MKYTKQAKLGKVEQSFVFHSICSLYRAAQNGKIEDCPKSLNVMTNF